MCTFYIVRHGETHWNVEKRLQGHKNSELTEQGIQQAKNLATKLQGIQFADIFSSDLMRAKKTAEIIALDRQIAVQTTKLLRERKLGRFEGEKVEFFRKELQYMLEKREQLSDEEQFTFKIHKNIETDQEMASRCLTFLREKAIAYQGKNVLVVSHSGMMRVLLVHLGFSSYKSLPHGAIQNSAYFILQSDGIDFFITETYKIKINQ